MTSITEKESGGTKRFELQTYYPTGLTEQQILIESLPDALADFRSQAPDEVRMTQIEIQFNRIEVLGNGSANAFHRIRINGRGSVDGDS